MFMLNPHSADFRFPPADLASPEGLLAIGGDLRAERLLEAYRHGIFPWYNEDQPILWWSPDPRAVLFPKKLKVSRSLKKTLRANTFKVSFDTCFREVTQACALPRRKHGAGGTWITREMLEAYCRLHEQGYAHSVESWVEDRLVGGLYGVALGGVFFGESMFSRASNASKVAFVHLVRQLEAWGYTLIDCQVPSAHLESLGAEEIRRRDFLTLLDKALVLHDRKGPWRFDSNLAVLNTQ
ncbi:MAG: leucyl/phenylalanyl-tRNA--protein transferase [Gammaproteobacteria bacterium]|nr:MAG: leucyl/phenylalanyl-tRNA--protein transferase [Gammaproteobacteria bacterium]